MPTKIHSSLTLSISILRQTAKPNLHEVQPLIPKVTTWSFVSNLSSVFKKLHSLLTIQWIISWQNTDRMNPISENLLSLVNFYSNSLLNSYHALTPSPAHYLVASKKNSPINTLQPHNIHHAIDLLRGIHLINNVYRCLQIYNSRNPPIEKHLFVSFNQFNSCLTTII